jgi:hypothetical protein
MRVAHAILPDENAIVGKKFQQDHISGCVVDLR